MNITFITTINTNVGDDFVREGIKFLLEKKFKNIKYSYINKHFPISARNGFEFITDIRIAKYLDKFLPLNLTRDKIFNSDMIVQSGAPVYWCHEKLGSHASNSDWYRDLIKRRYQAKAMNVPILNIAAVHAKGITQMEWKC